MKICFYFACSLLVFASLSGTAHADMLCGRAVEVSCIDSQGKVIAGDFSFCTMKEGAEEAATKACEDAGGTLTWSGIRQK